LIQAFLALMRGGTDSDRRGARQLLFHVLDGVREGW